MRAEQDGKCAICLTPEADTPGRRLQVDHCHVKGHVRKLLCAHCNRAIGLLKEDPAIIERAYHYVQQDHKRKE